MAVVIASDLGKDIAGEPLLRGISFKLERRDRMTLSGRNGAGQDDAAADARRRGLDRLRRAGAWPRARRWRSTTSARRASASLSLRDYVLSGARELVAIEEELASLEQAMAGGAYDERTLGRYAEAQARLEHAGGYRWRDEALATLHGLGFRDDSELDRSLRHVLGRRADAGIAGARAGRRPRPAAARRADEPPGHRVAGVARAAPGRRSTRRSCSSPTTAGSSRPSAPRCSSSRPAAGSSSRGRGTRGASEQAARELALGRAIERQQAEIERLERFVTRFRAGTRARQAQSRAKQLSKMERINRAPSDGGVASVRVQAAGAKRPGRCSSWAARRSPPATSCCSTTPSCGSSAASTCRWSDPTGRQDDADRDARRAAASWLTASSAPATTSRSATSPSTPTSSAPGDRADGRSRRRSTHRADARQGAGTARAVPVLRRGGGEAARRPVRRGAAAAVAGDPRPVRRERPDPRRADQPPRPRESRGARGGAAGVQRVAAARLPRPGAARRRRDADGRARGSDAPQLRRRLARVRAGASRASGGGREAGRGASREPGRSRSGRRRGRSRGRGRGDRRARAADRGRRGGAARARGRARGPGAPGRRPRRAPRSTARHERAKRAVEELYCSGRRSPAEFVRVLTGSYT